MALPNVLGNSQLVIPKENWDKFVTLDGVLCDIASCYYYLSAKLHEIVGRMAIGIPVSGNEAMKVTDYMYDIIFLWTLLHDPEYQNTTVWVAKFWSA